MTFEWQLPTSGQQDLDSTADYAGEAEYQSQQLPKAKKKMFGNEPGDRTLKGSKLYRTMTVLRVAGGALILLLVTPGDQPRATQVEGINGTQLNRMPLPQVVTVPGTCHEHASPELLVANWWIKLVLTFVAVIFAPATAAPEESCTWPESFLGSSGYKQ